jgi:hypothetical protein
MGEARLAVPRDVCVATKADIGVGEARVLGRANDGVDVSYEEMPEAPPSASRLLVDAEIGFGSLQIRDASDVPFDFDDEDFHGWRGWDDFGRDQNDNAACTAGPDAG